MTEYCTGAISCFPLYHFIPKSEAQEYQPVAWKKVVVGDFVKLRSDESIPADILLLNTSDMNSVCHIETANLDGETNLKQREVVKGLNMVINKPIRIRYLQYSPEHQKNITINQNYKKRCFLVSFDCFFAFLIFHQIVQ